MTDVFAPVEAEVNPDQVDYIAEMTKKFNKDGQLDIVALAKGKYEADNMVERVLLEKKTELEKLQRELETRMSVEEMLTKAVSTTPSVSTSQTPTSTVKEPDQNTSLKKEDVASLVESILSQKQTASTQEQNVNYVRQELTKLYGSNYTQALERRAQELELSLDDVRQLAATKPKMVLDMMQRNVQPVNTASITAPPSTVRPHNGVVKNEAYFQKMRRENPELYKSPEVQAERRRLAHEMGTAFFR